MAVRVRVDRSRCIGAGNCLTLAPTAFEWHAENHAKVELADPSSVSDPLLRAVAAACPTQAIELSEVDPFVPWQLRRPTSAPERTVRTFFFSDIVRSTDLVSAMGDEAWWNVLRWHDEALRSIFAAHRGEELRSTGDGFFIAFETPDDALAAAVAVQRKLAEHRRSSGFAPQVRIGIHAAGVTQLGKNVQGKGIHVAARIAALANGGEILVSRETAAGTRAATSTPRSVELRGIDEPVDVVSVDWQ